MDAKLACAIAGIHYKVADYWAREAGIAPTTQATGKGSRRAYTFADVVGLRLAARMRHASVPLRVIAAAVAHVRERHGLGGPDARLPGVWLAVSSDGMNVFEVRGGSPLPRQKISPRCVIHLAPLGLVVAEVAEAFTAPGVTRRRSLSRTARSLRVGRKYG